MYLYSYFVTNSIVTGSEALTSGCFDEDKCSVYDAFSFLNNIAVLTVLHNAALF